MWITSRSTTLILEKETYGRVHQLTFGRSGALTVVQTRDLAKIKIGETAKGKDSARECRQYRCSITFGELEKRHLAHHAEMGAANHEIVSTVVAS